jgi:hypothetical protein
MVKKVLGAIGAVVILGGYTAYDYFTGSEFGDPCQWNNDCKGSFYGKMGAQCLDMGQGGFCTVACDDNTDCTGGWICQAFDYYETDDTGNKKPSGQNTVCAPPVAASPAMMPGQAPQPTAPRPVQPAPAPAPAPVTQ